MKQRQLYTNERDLIESYSLEPAEYLIVPSTLKPNMSGDFVLTVYTKTDAKIRSGITDMSHMPYVPLENVISFVCMTQTGSYHLKLH